jgi:hemerythrin superfamily protein
MSLFDKAVAAVTPPESQEARNKAREKAYAAAGPGDWLSLVLDHHLQLESAFAAVKAAGDANSRMAAQKKLGVTLTGHAIAEEAVLYPALAQADEKGHANMGYTEQVAVKMQMAALETLDPMSEDYLDKLEHIRGAVAHHMYEEEGTWFPELKDKEEFDRYVGGGAEPQSAVANEPRTWSEPRAEL